MDLYLPINKWEVLSFPNLRKRVKREALFFFKLSKQTFQVYHESPGKAVFIFSCFVYFHGAVVLAIKTGKFIGYEKLPATMKRNEN